MGSFSNAGIKIPDDKQQIVDNILQHEFRQYPEANRHVLWQREPSDHKEIFITDKTRGQTQAYSLDKRVRVLLLRVHEPHDPR